MERTLVVSISKSIGACVLATSIGACSSASRPRLHALHTPSSQYALRCTPSARPAIAVVGAVAVPTSVPLDRAVDLGAALRAAGGPTKAARRVEVLTCAASGEARAWTGELEALTADDLRLPLTADAMVVLETDDD